MVALFGLVALAALSLFFLRARGGQPVMVPDPRSLTVAIALASVGGLIIALSLEVPVHLGYLAFGMVIAAFLLGGASLRPRGSRLRGLMLGISAYLLAGVISFLIMNQGFIDQQDLLAWMIQVPTWPGLWFLLLGGFLGG